MVRNVQIFLNFFKEQRCRYSNYINCYDALTRLDWLSVGFIGIVTFSFMIFSNG